MPDALRPALGEVWQEIHDLESRIERIERQLEALAQQTPVVERLRSIPGIGLLNATALIAFVGDIQRFPSAGHFASYLVLTPREYSSASERRLGRISKRGDACLRMLIIHGARSVLCHAKRMKQPDRSAPGPFASRRPPATTRPPSPSPTSSPGSLGPSGKRTRPSSRWSRPPRAQIIEEELDYPPSDCSSSE